MDKGKVRPRKNQVTESRMNKTQGKYHRNNRKMYDEGVLKFRYRKGKLVKRFQSGEGEEGEERQYEGISIRGKRKTRGK